MRIEGTHLIEAPRERVWKYLTDPDIIAKCLPGCEKLEPAGDNLYEATLRIGIGAMKGTFSSHIRMKVLDPGKQYQLSVEGKGVLGFLKGEGVISLDDSAQPTNVLYQGEVQIGGVIAGVGQRMIQGFARQTISHFFAAMAQEMTAEA